ncbi:MULTISPECIES: IclR family transcriptional regulator [Priestia]|jgi:DNA-binding IclR family transcriptional regulator|uniref:Glycerol operon regulatory protein n=2 Tax=Priestia megaterium TaxID=1404 RepID=A0A1Q8UQW3_PRIMG|nr:MULTISPECIES: IclR family transcriptional regulator [Priestia]MCJ7988292.1 IclR family transcriptional regulator [Priestia sp. OVS21]AJI22663.1 iclR helix-turn-helix domain protein [Priestia megaterium NBRC 15308 = ATCC 14581]AXI28600.1 IclR family transcriptional regulator [Priestia megaterium]KFM97510.1 bacterial transcriptional regulator family protein [Priestia megaterium]KGJ78467.1 IclR family transcriptional regulator [Priestia megaterium NBRC 15308 = ATCC 14581]
MPIIQSVDRALRILDLFDEHTTELKITDISDQIGLHKSTVHSLLKTLQQRGYIHQNLENGKYGLGMKLFERGNYVIQSLDIRQLAKKYLMDLSAKTGQTTHLVILDGKEGTYIDKVEGPMAVILYSRIGKRIPLHCSAVGKALIAFKEKDELEKILSGYEYTEQTEFTITNEIEFLQELEKVQSQGYAVDNQENEPGVRCIAAPIRNHENKVIAAISLSTLIAGVDDIQLGIFVQQLKQAASELSEQMGYGIPI